MGEDRVGVWGIVSETAPVVPNFGHLVESLGELETVLMPRQHPRPIKRAHLGEDLRPSGFKVPQGDPRVKPRMKTVVQGEDGIPACSL